MERLVYFCIDTRIRNRNIDRIRNRIIVSEQLKMVSGYARVAYEPPVPQVFGNNIGSANEVELPKVQPELLSYLINQC